MIKKRTQIPKQIEYEILFKNDMTCCICHTREKGIIIHHIDENPSNNNSENLAIICQEHHDEVHLRGGLTKKITPKILIKYKQHWESFIIQKRKIMNSPLQSNFGIEKILFEFEIRKTAYEIISLNDNNIAEIKQKLEYLETMYLTEQYTSEILDALNKITILASFQKNKSAMIAKCLHHYIYHLAGPENIPIKKSDILNIRKITKMLGTIGYFSEEFNRSEIVINNIISSFYFLLEVTKSYNLSKEVKLILIEIDTIIKHCKFDSDKKDGYCNAINRLAKLKKQHELELRKV